MTILYWILGFLAFIPLFRLFVWWTRMMEKRINQREMLLAIYVSVVHVCNNKMLREAKVLLLALDSIVDGLRKDRWMKGIRNEAIIIRAGLCHAFNL